MRVGRFAACIVTLSALVTPSLAQGNFGLPSCISTLVSGPASAFRRFIPNEVKGPSELQMRGVVARSLTWRPGQTIRVCFKSGSRGAHERVIRVGREWMQYANIVFDFEDNGAPRLCTSDGREDIKIDFKDFQGWWSAYGTLSRQRDPSMNLQFFGVDTPRYSNGAPAPEAELRRTILHEFGHALGMMHEHQSPAASCDQEINWDAAYKMGAQMGWDREKVHAQMGALTQIAEFNVTEVDRKSIMHYSLPPELFKLGRNSPCWIADNDDLSARDKSFIAATYPKSGAPVETSGMPPSGAPSGALTRGAKPPVALNDREALVRQYAELLKQAGVAAERIAQLTQEFRKTVLGQ